MVIAAKKLSEMATHMAIAFTIMHVMTGSVAFGGLAALLEPAINVMLLPMHERIWNRMRSRSGMPKAGYMTIALQKLSQLGMHMTVAFAVMYWATGSMAFGGLAAVLEPICNVIVLPLHERLWSRLQAGLVTRATVTVAATAA
ncbi:putative membrane protein [Paucimonas lemoignei]|uniref:Putative membrane protein n=1 Tax=Paucimonas lemoignei TaxID=29443 RepID=A0A4R3HPX3_PAULE|nr:DUF2061 domain-containing protein [Paucimonas lemoignei]TCS33976.1 putative membrane protein [Paucimonas lemoignei]